MRQISNLLAHTDRIANDVEASVGGEVVEVLVEDGQAVEFGQVLAKVKA